MIFDLFETFGISDWIFLFFICVGIYWFSSRIFSVIEFLHDWIEKKKDI